MLTSLVLSILAFTLGVLALLFVLGWIWPGPGKLPAGSKTSPEKKPSVVDTKRRRNPYKS